MIQEEQLIPVATPQRANSPPVLFVLHSIPIVVRSLVNSLRRAPYVDPVLTVNVMFKKFVVERLPSVLLTRSPPMVCLALRFLFAYSQGLTSKLAIIPGTSCGANNLACASGVCTSLAMQCTNLGSSLGITQACRQTTQNCRVTCQSPSSSNTCIVLDSSFRDGSPCGCKFIPPSPMS